MSTTKSYPVKPSRPADSDCCGNGCSTCVFDLYELDIKRWEKKCKEIDANLKSSCEPYLNIYEYVPLVIADIEHVSNTVSIFTFKILEKQDVQLRCGQHIVLRCMNNDGKSIIRPYTPYIDPDKHGVLFVAVKLYAQGQMSNCMKLWKKDTTVDCRGPFGDFIYKPNEFSNLLLLAGGSGLTAVLPVLQQIVNNEDDLTRVHLLYSFQNPEDIMFHEKLYQWGSFWNVSIVYCITQLQKDQPTLLKYGEKFSLSRIDSSALLNCFPSNVTNLMTLICGTSEFNTDMENLVKNVYNVNKEMTYCFC